MRRKSRSPRCTTSSRALWSASIRWSRRATAITATISRISSRCSMKSTKSQSIMYIGDKENSNTDSALVSTKRSLIFNELNKSLYQKFFMTVEELQACRDGYIYIHDMSARRDTMNCCLFDVNEVLSGGFEMGNIWYNEPKTLDVAFDVIGDIVLSAASQQYGGFTVPSVENILAPYAEKSYGKYIEKYIDLGLDEEKAKEIAWNDVQRDGTGLPGLGVQVQLRFLQPR